MRQRGGGCDGGHRNILAAGLLHIRSSSSKPRGGSMKRILAVTAVVALASCSSMPSWMPGSGAMKVNLSGAEEVPPVSTQAKGSGSFRVDKEGHVTGSVTTEGINGTMAHIHQAAK